MCELIALTFADIVRLILLGQGGIRVVSSLNGADLSFDGPTRCTYKSEEERTCRSHYDVFETSVSVMISWSR